MSVEWKAINKILWCIQAEGGVQKKGTDFHRISRKYCVHFHKSALWWSQLISKEKAQEEEKQKFAPYPSSNWIYEKHNNHYSIFFFNLNGN